MKHKVNYVNLKAMIMRERKKERYVDRSANETNHITINKLNLYTYV